ncbi:uncharacterized protein LOC123670500 isoform X1 [Melitaea cinxia]|uniref:uncharacterized protein LOC123670500 isoform X1 n=1 Tax=Melitaea cinxia TaxID=113334 RepID=UPI001E273003|nr:uncharacterized protein LOC123670500 isoform X1 [Melitaea cinxia]
MSNALAPRSAFEAAATYVAGLGIVELIAVTETNHKINVSTRSHTLPATSAGSQATSSPPAQKGLTIRRRNKSLLEAKKSTRARRLFEVLWTVVINEYTRGRLIYQNGRDGSHLI